MTRLSVVPLVVAALALGCDQQGYEDQFEDQRRIPGCQLAPEELQASCVGATLLWEGRDQDSARVIADGCLAKDCPNGDCGDRPGRCTLGVVRDKDGGEGRTWSVWVVMVKDLENIRPRPFEEWERLAHELRQAREQAEKPLTDQPQAALMSECELIHESYDANCTQKSGHECVVDSEWYEIYYVWSGDESCRDAALAWADCGAERLGSPPYVVDAWKDKCCDHPSCGPGPERNILGCIGGKTTRTYFVG